jgi:hypothetical protein
MRRLSSGVAEPRDASGRPDRQSLANMSASVRPTVPLGIVAYMAGLDTRGMRLSAVIIAADDAGSWSEVNGLGGG